MQLVLLLVVEEDGASWEMWVNNCQSPLVSTMRNMH